MLRINTGDRNDPLAVGLSLGCDWLARCLHMHYRRCDQETATNVGSPAWSALPPAAPGPPCDQPAVLWSAQARHSAERVNNQFAHQLQVLQRFCHVAPDQATTTHPLLLAITRGHSHLVEGLGSAERAAAVAGIKLQGLFDIQQRYNWQIWSELHVLPRWLRRWPRGSRPPSGGRR
jgi:hypothetical protein